MNLLACATRAPTVHCLALAAVLTASALPAQVPPALPAGALPTGEIVDPVPCAKFPGESYALYLPQAYTPERRWPVLYAFDARQHGRQVAELYRDAAERLGWIVVSSNNSRSDEPNDPNGAAMQAMWDDSHERFALAPHRAYATGFSGGARVACLLAQAHAGEVAGVIGHGGGFPVNRPPSASTPFAFFGLAGRRDFNFPELLRLDHTLGELGLDHHFEGFDGEHSWAPPEEAGLALEWMELLAMRCGLAPRNDTLIGEIWRHFLSRAQASAASDSVAAARGYDGLWRDFAGLRPADELAGIRRKLDDLRASPRFAAESAAQTAEEIAQAAYLERAQSRLRGVLADTDDWNATRAARTLEIPQLRKQQERAATAYARDAAARSLASLFVETVFYLPRDLAARGDFGRALHLIEIAQEIRPDGAGAWYALGAMRARSGDPRGAVSALRRASETGRIEAEQLQSDPDLVGLRERGDFQKLLAKLRAQPPASPERASPRQNHS